LSEVHKIHKICRLQKDTETKTKRTFLRLGVFDGSLLKDYKFSKFSLETLKSSNFSNTLAFFVLLFGATKLYMESMI